jgi:hypothetical protein
VLKLTSYVHLLLFTTHATHQIVVVLTMDYPYRVFFAKNTYFVGINARELEERHLTDDIRQPFPEKPKRLWVRRVSVQAFPHLPFVLADEIIPSCSPFEPLQFIVVVNKDGRPAGRYGKGRYGLSAERCREWKSLEEDLKRFAEGLLYFAKQNNVKFVRLFKPLSSSHLPSAWKYDMDFPTEHEALSTLHHALAGFQMLMALISYGIMLCRADRDAPGHPQWAAFLQDRYKVEAVFVDAIKASPLNNFTCRRVGAFVTQESVDDTWVSHIRYMEDALCPIYILWPSHENWSGVYAPVMAKYKPSADLVNQSRNPWSAAMRSPSPSCLSNSDTYNRPGSSLATTVPDDGVNVFRDDPDDYDTEWPSVEPSEQHPGESMEDFFRRQDRRRARVLMTQDPKGHQAIRERERQAKSHPVPGNKGPAVYVWLPNKVTGWVKRVRVTKQCVNDAFTSHNNSTRRFDAVLNCWDCYSGWAPKTAPDSRYFEDDEGDDGSFFIPMPAVSSAPPSQPTATNDVSVEDQAQSSNPPTTELTNWPSSPLAPLPVPSSPLPLSPSSLTAPPATGHSSSAVQPPSPVIPSLPTSMTSPLLPAPSSPAPVSVPSAPPSSEHFMDVLYHRFGFLWDGYEDEVEDGQVDETKRIYNAMRTFLADGDALDPVYHRRFLTFSAMLSKQGGTDSKIWDLEASNPRCLQRPPTSIDEVFSIATLHPVDGRVFYDVKPPMQQEFRHKFFHLLSASASTAVECYRRHFPSISQSARCLVDSGKPFRTFMKLMRPQKYSRPKLAALPHRKKSYIFTHLDFVSYERMLERFFQYPHARAALLEGGILWRIAVEYLDPQVAVSGPSDSANDFGDRISLPEGETFVDDSLSEDERDLICGTCVVYTGNATWFFSQSIWS